MMYNIIYYMSQPQLKTYDELIIEYERVSDELTNLKKDYEENTIIQSMNDMKQIYDKQTKKMKKMSDIIDNMNETTKVVKLMLKTLIKNSNVYSSRRDVVNKFELNTRLEFINEILSESLKTKNELYYFNIE
jgi:hypothetical protein